MINKISVHESRLVKGAVFLAERPSTPAKRRFGFITKEALPQRPAGWYIMSELVFRGMPHKIDMSRHFARFGRLYTRPFVVVTTDSGVRLTNYFDNNVQAYEFAAAHG